MPELETAVLAEVEWLLARGADPALTDDRGQTALELTTGRAEPTFVEKLRTMLASGARAP